jgi:hypothetical protein
MNQVVRMSISGMSASTEKSLEYRRRAVYTALIQHLDGDELWEALALWEDNYAASANFSAQRFLSDVLNTPELRGKRVRVFQGLIRMLASPASDLLPDPREQLLVYRMRRGKTSAVTSSRDPAVVACSSLLARILRGLDENNRLRMRLFILDQLEKSGIDVAMRAAVRTWLSDQTRLALDTATIGDLRRLINLAYIGLCEYVGPVAADAALNKAFRGISEEEAELLPQLRTLL